MLTCFVGTAQVPPSATITKTLFALDKAGKPVAALSPEQITAEIKGQKAQVLGVKNLGQEPWSVVILIDRSRSSWESVVWKSPAVLRTLDVLMHETSLEKNRLAIASFETIVNIDQGFTSDPQKWVNALMAMEQGGGTALYDGLVLAAKELSKEQNQRRFIFLFSDGEDTQSRYNREEAIRMVKDSGVTIFTWCFCEYNGVYGGTSLMKRLAKETGGTFFYAGKDKEMIKTAESLRDVMHSEFELKIAVPPSGNVEKVSLKAPDMKLAYAEK